MNQLQHNSDIAEREVLGSQRRSPPSTQPEHRPWWRLHLVTIAILLVGIIQISHHLWFVNSNPPPRLEELETQRIEVLAWQRLHPQLHVRLADSVDRMVEFPTLNMGGRDVYWVISPEEQRQLVGKACQMWGRPLRASIQDHYQVFALNCDDGSGLAFNDSLKDYRLSFEFHTSFRSLMSSVFIYLVGLALTYWAETYRIRNSNRAFNR